MREIDDRYADHEQEWQEEENDRRADREFRQRLINTDRDYPDQLHMADVAERMERHDGSIFEISANEPTRANTR